MPAKTPDEKSILASIRVPIAVTILLASFVFAMSASTRPSLSYTAVVFLLGVSIIAIIMGATIQGHFFLASPVGIMALYLLAFTGIPALTEFDSLSDSASVLSGYFIVGSAKTPVVLALFVATYCAGALLSPQKCRNFNDITFNNQPASLGLSNSAVVRLGRVALVVVGGYFTLTAITRDVSSRGVGQVIYNPTASLGVAMLIVGFGSTIVLLQSSASYSSLLASRWEWFLVLWPAVAHAATGARHYAAGVVIVIGVYAILRGRLRLKSFVVWLSSIVALNWAVEIYRSGESFSLGGVGALWDSLLRTTESVRGTTAVVVSLVPQVHPFYGGSTIISSVGQVIPRPLIRIFVPDGTYGTGSYAFREVTGFDDPNQGFGFSLPAEGYLNWGVAGVAIAGFGVGCLSAILWKRLTIELTVASGSLYLMFAGYFTFMIRADFLSLLKWLVYGFIYFALVISVGRRAFNRNSRYLSQPKSGELTARNSSHAREFRP